MLPVIFSLIAVYHIEQFTFFLCFKPVTDQLPNIKEHKLNAFIHD